MNACRNWISTSKAVMMTVTTNDVAENNRGANDRVNRYQDASPNTSSSKCPASMLAISRIESVNGRTKTFEMNSMGTSSHRIHHGAPDGTQIDLRYPSSPCDLIPIVRNVIHTISARPTGYAYFDVAGNSISGMIPNRFITQMKKNSETRNGRYLSPSLPSIGRRIWSRTNSTPYSPTFCMPLGTIFGLRNASQKKPRTIAPEITASSSGLSIEIPPMVAIGRKKKSPTDGAG